MSEEWFEVAYINCDEAILHGQLARGGVGRANVTVRKELSADEKRRIEDMNERHQRAMQRLLREMAA